MIPSRAPRRGTKLTFKEAQALPWNLKTWMLALLDATRWTECRDSRRWWSRIKWMLPSGDPGRHRRGEVQRADPSGSPGANATRGWSNVTPGRLPALRSRRWRCSAAQGREASASGCSSARKLSTDARFRASRTAACAGAPTRRQTHFARRMRVGATLATLVSAQLAVRQNGTIVESLPQSGADRAEYGAYFALDQDYWQT